MQWLAARMKWVMLVSGALTCTMLYAALAPQASLFSTFGETSEGAVAEIVTRNWGTLVALVGAMLIYGAFRPEVRPLVLVVAGLSKLTFIALVLAEGTRYLGHGAGVAVAVDAVMVLLFALYLFYGRGASNAVP
jgi:hypothetical protein